MSVSNDTSLQLLYFCQSLLVVVLFPFLLVLGHKRWVRFPRLRSAAFHSRNSVATCACTFCRTRTYALPNSALCSLRRQFVGCVVLVLLLLFVHSRIRTQLRKAEAELGTPHALLYIIFDVSDPWEILQVRENASKTEIRTAYRRLVLVFHPDKLDKAFSREMRDKFFERLQLINKAYETLTDRDLRRRFDLSGSMDDHFPSRSGFDIPMFSSKKGNAARVLFLYLMGTAAVFGSLFWAWRHRKSYVNGVREETLRLFLARNAVSNIGSGQSGTATGRLENVNQLKCDRCFANEKEMLALLSLAFEFQDLFGTEALASLQSLRKRVAVLKTYTPLKRLGAQFRAACQKYGVDLDTLDFDKASLVHVFFFVWTTGVPLPPSLSVSEVLLTADRLLDLLEEIALANHLLGNLYFVNLLRRRLLMRGDFSEFHLDDAVFSVVVDKETTELNFSDSPVVPVLLRFCWQTGGADKEHGQSDDQQVGYEALDDLDKLNWLRRSKDIAEARPVLVHSEYPFPLFETFLLIVKEKDSKDPLLVEKITIAVPSGSRRCERSFSVPFLLQSFVFKNEETGELLKTNKRKSSVILQLVLLPLCRPSKKTNLCTETELSVKYPVQSSTESENADLPDTHKAELEEMNKDYEENNFFNIQADKSGKWYLLGAKNSVEFLCNLLMLYITFLVVISSGYGKKYLRPLLEKAKQTVLNYLRRSSKK